MRQIFPVHPFPARMAPEIALQECTRLAPGSLVLDPMVGSGMVVRTASEQGHRAIGFDMDPLAVLMTRVWTTPLNLSALQETADRVVNDARALDHAHLLLPWIDEDPETRSFVNYWFGQAQQADLRKLSKLLSKEEGTVGDALRIALSRIIVTKDRGASLARDVSHSRPHRAFESHDFPVVEEFQRSVRRLADRLRKQPPPGRVTVYVGDARQLTPIRPKSVDAVITSPPYLNAIDYMRGHRLTLVWLGYRLRDLRDIRAESIGSERRPDPGTDLDLARELRLRLKSTWQLPSREQSILDRYVVDLLCTMKELHRVLRSGATAVLVVGNSWIRGLFVENTKAVCAAAERVGLQFLSQHERVLPASHRYLPPPTDDQHTALQRRMRTESVLRFLRP